VKKLFIALCMTLLLAPAAYSSELKVGYVVIDKILSEAPQVKAINEKMKERFGGKKKELDDMEKDMKSMQENYKRNELVMTDDKLNDLKSKMAAKYQKYKQSEASLQQEVNTMRSQELATLRDTIRSILSKIAKKGGYDLILSEGVVYGSKELDLSDEVLTELKKEYKNKKK
jgi:outer membrane protein